MNDLTFRETPTGWDVKAPVFSFHGDRFHVVGRLEMCYERGFWVYLPSDGDSLSLSELDQIRHKLANLEQIRLNKLALQEMKDGN